MFQDVFNILPLYVVREATTEQFNLVISYGFLFYHHKGYSGVAVINTLVSEIGV